jgi:hypothetical protein
MVIILVRPLFIINRTDDVSRTTAMCTVQSQSYTDDVASALQSPEYTDMQSPEHFMSVYSGMRKDTRAQEAEATPSWAVLSRSEITDPASTVWPRYINRHAMAHAKDTVKPKQAI